MLETLAARSMIRVCGTFLAMLVVGWVGAKFAAPMVPSELVLALTVLIASTGGLLVVCVHHPAMPWPLSVVLLVLHVLTLVLLPWTGGTPAAALQLSDTWAQARHCGAMALLFSLPFMPYALVAPEVREVPRGLAWRTMVCGLIVAALALELHCALPAMEYRWLGHAAVPVLLVMGISLEVRRPFRTHLAFYAGLVLLMASSYFLSRYLTQEESSTAAVKAPEQKEALRATLTAEQYTCTQENGTETPFHNAYWDNHADGIYVDVVSGEPLFASLDKFDSGSGWPSFTHPLEDNIVEKRDASLGTVRTEVRSRGADSHLGHVFDDGPGPSGQRFCINSASLRFVPLEALHAQKLDRYLFLFADKKHWDIATLAGGCFWGMQELLSKRPGVITSQVGYTGGLLSHPTYDDVSTGSTGHAESLQILFDPKQTTYESLLLFFFRMHDPTTQDRQVNDVGTQYRSAIFYRGDEQKRVATEVKARVDASGAWKRPVVTEVSPLGAFWRAEESHQDYLDKHPFGYTCHEVRNMDFTVKP